MGTIPLNSSITSQLSSPEVLPAGLNYLLLSVTCCRLKTSACPEKWCGCALRLCGASDWHAHEVIKEEPACVALNKALLSLVRHYMRVALASQAQLPHVLHFPSLICRC